ncbi:MAG: TolC family protein [Acidobacteriota bacterium]
MDKTLMLARWALLLAVIMGAVPSPAAAQDVAAATGGMTLDEVVARGVASSQRLLELDARQEGAEAAVAGRRAATRPMVALAGGYTRTNHVDEFGITVPGLPPRIIYPDIPDNAHARLDLQWPLYTGGRAEALERAARGERKAAGYDLAAARADLRLELTRAFWAVVTARETERVVGASLGSLGAHVSDLRTRLEQGLIPPNDLLTAETQQSRERMLAIEAANRTRVAEADLRRLLGLDDEAPLLLAATLAAPAADSELPAALASSARQLRPERAALRSRVEAFQARGDAARSGARPQIAVGGGYDYARPNPRIFPRIGEWRDSWDLSVTASWLLVDGGRRRAEVAEALAGVRGAEARAADFDRQVGFEVRQRWLELDSSQAAIAAAEEGVASATEARRVVGERFRAGVAINSDLLDAELALLQARLDRTRAIAGARLAEARLARAVGR